MNARPEKDQSGKNNGVIGPIAARAPEAPEKQLASHLRHVEVRLAWGASTQPAWLTCEMYCQEIQPLLAGFSHHPFDHRLEVPSGSWPHSRRLPPASETLAGSGATGGRYRRRSYKFVLNRHVEIIAQRRQAAEYNLLLQKWRLICPLPPLTHHNQTCQMSCS